MGDGGCRGMILEILGILLFGGLILFGAISAVSHIATHLSVTWR